VLIRVRASSANLIDLYQLSALAHLQRGRKPAVIGTDVAGTVEAVGRSVTAFSPGDEVLGAARGAFAELACAQERHLVRKPASVPFEDAGTLAVAGSTALQALRDHGCLRSGQRVLINGASGGVGTFAVQIAKALRAEVTGVCSTRNAEMVRAIGADTIIDYTTQDFTRTGAVYDLLIDIAGSRSWSEYSRVLPRGATYVGVGAAAIQHGKGGGMRVLKYLAQSRLRAIGSGRRVVSLFIAKLNAPDLEFLAELVASGRVKPVVEKRYGLADVPEALAYIEAGHLRGKLAIAID
jgi:NADPH:quinone reductase-like Zn-dependent oxidoreductase